MRASSREDMLAEKYLILDEDPSIGGRIGKLYLILDEASSSKDWPVELYPTLDEDSDRAMLVISISY